MSTYMKIKAVIFLLCLVLFTSCSSIVNTKSEQSDITAEDLNKYSLLLSSLDTSEGIVELKVDPLSNTKDIYDAMYVSYNNIHNIYNWQNTTNEAFKPTICYRDVNNDGTNEIIVILTLGYGTGLYQSEIHILNSNDLKEYEVENISNYIKEHIKTSIDGRLKISIKDEIQYVSMDSFVSDALLYKEAYLENYITYEVINDRINANVAVQVSNTDFLGSLIFEYSFKDNAFYVSKVYYVEE